MNKCKKSIQSSYAICVAKGSDYFKDYSLETGGVVAGEMRVIKARLNEAFGVWVGLEASERIPSPSGKTAIGSEARSA